MKKIFPFLLVLILFVNCHQAPAKKNNRLRDGFYQVDQRGTDSTRFNALKPNEISIAYTSIYNEQDYTKLVLDTSDFVPLELEKTPVIQKDTAQKSRLSIILSAGAVEKLKTFTASRISKTVAIVLNNEAITMHKIKDTIRGGEMVISWCGENACQKLYTQIKGNVKK